MTFTSGRPGFGAWRRAWWSFPIPWAGEEDHAVGAGDERFQGGPLLLRHAELLQGEKSLGLVENAESQAFSVLGGNASHADVHIPVPQRDADASVLGNKALGNVHAGHDLIRLVRGA
jgi:hypothetical protein